MLSYHMHLHQTLTATVITALADHTTCCLGIVSDLVPTVNVERFLSLPHSSELVPDLLHGHGIAVF